MCSKHHQDLLHQFQFLGEPGKRKIFKHYNVISREILSTSTKKEFVSTSTKKGFVSTSTKKEFVTLISA